MRRASLNLAAMFPFGRHTYTAKLDLSDELPEGSVDQLIDIGDFCLYDHEFDIIRELILQHCSNDCVLYAPFVAIFNHWLRIITKNGQLAPVTEFVDSGLRNTDNERIYCIPIWKVLQEVEDVLDFLPAESKKVDDLDDIFSAAQCNPK